MADSLADILKANGVTGEALEHVGVKGMKWGVRRSRAERRAARKEANSAPSATKVVTAPSRRGSQEIQARAKAGKKVTTKGGKKNLASDDAIVAAIAKQKAKASTTDSLTNAELKSAVTRMELEQKYTKLAKNEPRQKRGAALVKAFFSNPEYANMAFGNPIADTLSTKK